MRTIIGGVLAVVAAAYADAQILPADPVFATGFENGALSLTPAAAYVAQGASGDTLPAALTLTLSAPVAVDTFVPIVSAEPARLGVIGGGTTVPAGQSSATVQVSGLAGGAMPVTLTATLGNAVAAGVRVEAALNEAGSAAGEADYCALQFPASYSIGGGQAGPSIYGRLYQSGATEPAGPPSGWLAALGYGPSGTDPRLLAGWRFFDAAYNLQVGNDDEFTAVLTAPWAIGGYAYTFRFSRDQGVSWTYCDINGAGANAGLAFDAAALGQMTVTRSLVINEVDYDNPGATDTAEFVEILNTAPTAANLAGLALVLVNGNDNAEYRRVDLGAAGTLPAGGYLVVHAGALPLPAGTLSLTFPGCSDGCIQNGAPDGVALIDSASHTLIDALSYEGGIAAAAIGGFAAPVSLVEGTPLSVGVADSNSVDGSLIRNPNGTDTDDANSDWTFSAAPTPGAANTP